jgi:hypothetical protein
MRGGVGRGVKRPEADGVHAESARTSIWCCGDHSTGGSARRATDFMRQPAIDSRFDENASEIVMFTLRTLHLSRLAMRIRACRCIRHQFIEPTRSPGDRPQPGHPSSTGSDGAARVILDLVRRILRRGVDGVLRQRTWRPGAERSRDPYLRRSRTPSNSSAVERGSGGAGCRPETERCLRPALELAAPKSGSAPAGVSYRGKFGRTSHEGPAVSRRD